VFHVYRVVVSISVDGDAVAHTARLVVWGQFDWERVAVLELKLKIVRLKTVAGIEEHDIKGGGVFVKGGLAGLRSHQLLSGVYLVKRVTLFAT
jgi:hypothetical protein